MHGRHAGQAGKSSGLVPCFLLLNLVIQRYHPHDGKVPWQGSVRVASLVYSNETSATLFDVAYALVLRWAGTTRMHEEVHLPCSLDGFNVRLELVLDTRGHLRRLRTWCPNRCGAMHLTPLRYVVSSTS